MECESYKMSASIEAQCKTVAALLKNKDVILECGFISYVWIHFLNPLWTMFRLVFKNFYGFSKFSRKYYENF